MDEMQHLAYASGGRTIQPMGDNSPSICSASPTAAAPTATTTVSMSKGVRLFGVKLVDQQSCSTQDFRLPSGVSMGKSLSVGNFGLMGFQQSAQRHADSMHTHMQQDTATMQPCLALGTGRGDVSIRAGKSCMQRGYVSDGLMQSSRERRKGVPWTEEEHRLFLAGLQKLGKGDWRGISRNFVTTRTPTQVASHAQKYFLRQCNPNERKRRSSLFDIINYNNSTVAKSSSIQKGPHTRRPAAATAGEQLNRPYASRGLSMRHFTVPCVTVTNRTNPGSPLLKPPMSVSGANVNADLCLGRPSSSRLQGQEQHVFGQDCVLSPHSRRAQGEHTAVMDAFLLSRNRDTVGLDDVAQRAELDYKASITISSCSSSRSSLSSSPSSSSSSVCRVDEATELSSVSLSIAPPIPSDHASELALTLEPPTAMSHSSAVLSSTAKVCQCKDVLLIAGA